MYLGGAWIVQELKPQFWTNVTALTADTVGGCDGVVRIGGAGEKARPARSRECLQGVRTMARVAIARKTPFSDRRRAALGISGVVLALLIVLALDGIFAGAMGQVTRYIDTADADVFVPQQGVRHMHMSASSIPIAALQEVAEIGGWIR